MTVIAGFSGWVLELEVSEDAGPAYMEAQVAASTGMREPDFIFRPPLRPLDAFLEGSTRGRPGAYQVPAGENVNVQPQY